ncbi:NosD domain-containing protein [Mesorhizobium sp. VK23B]|uniref:NosD domain-containing protein n=1 Tax=Mesorhizobium dulcispinae TaxID=3072316 RepID=A0ABU4XKL8_9HYPH|nr:MULTISPECIES: NosD domain-containing protein [unclassified Mesorhizobium]MDX8468923.1 NosD domain-containing protein [Mesorhizobium sp. VK23B]MDX8475288.1 NosD domain-containing protein [Mesorhizobium sp. VK23A]
MARPATAAVRLLTGEREPVRLATIANIDLDTGGLLVIDGVQTEVGDRILVKDQTDGSENGIRTVSAGQWFRAADARTARTLQYGTTVTVQEGSVNGGKTFRFNTLDPVIGDDPISIVEYPLGGTAPAVARDYIDAPVYVADRAALAALDTSRDKVALIWSEGGRNGVFVFDASNQAVNVTNDPQQGVMVAPSSDITGASGAWRRIDLVSSTSAAGAVSPLWFGVTLDGADSAAAFSAFLDFLIYTGIAGELPAGTITLGSRITKNIGTAGLALGGQGEDISVLLWTSADGGLNITSTHATGKVQWSRQVELHHFSIKASQASGGTALSHTISPVSASSTSIMFDYHDLSIQGLDVDADYWDNGIVVTDGWNGTIERCSIKGIDDDGLSPFLMQTGVELIRCNDCHVNQNHMYHMTTGIKSTSDVGSYGDGLSIIDNRIIGVDYGVVGVTSLYNQWFLIGSNHINAYRKGIALTNIGYTPIEANIIFKTSFSTQNNWPGIELINPVFNIVKGNAVQTPGAPGSVTNFGVFLSGGHDNQIRDNTFQNVSGAFFGIYLTVGNEKSRITGNVADSAVGQIIAASGQGTGHICRDNWPITQYTVFADGDATPSVGLDYTGLVKTSNSGATNITTFDDGFEGQEFELQVLDTNTTLVHGAALLLRGAASVTPPNGGVVCFRRYPTAWREVWRSFADNNIIVGTYGAAAQSKLHSYNSLNGLSIGVRVENDNGGSPVAGIGFQVTARPGESPSAKGGIGFTRSNTNGRGWIGIYNRSTNDSSDFTTTDLISRWNGKGIFSPLFGTTIASAATIVPSGNTFHVSGTTSITSIDATDISGGAEITMIFDGSLTVVNGGNMKLAGNFSAGPLDTLTLKWDGSNWYEKSRSANV